MCQVDSFVHLRLTADTCLGKATGINAIDRARRGGHYYSNKAPGMAVLAIPAYEAVQLHPPAFQRYDLRLWVERAVTAGVFFLLCAFLVGRVAEGLAPGFGAPALVAFALGTLALPFAAHNFDHVPAMALGFAAFLLLWSRRPLGAGLVTGLALLVEYEEVVVLIALGAYALWLGRATLLRFTAGVLPGALLLAAYDWAAFGAPWHNPLSYSDNQYRAEHAGGLLGVHVPKLTTTRLVFVGDRGLLLTSPVLILAALGLLLLWRRGLRAETLVCAGVSAVLLLSECGYFDPYGGVSPGPRYLIPALPFVAVGLGPAFARWTVATSVAAAASIAAQCAMLVTWAANNGYPHSVWFQMWKFVTDHSHSLLLHSLARNALEWLGPGRTASTFIVWALATTAFALSLVAMRRRA